MRVQEALESAQSKLSYKMNSTIFAHLRDKVAARRPVAGLGARHDDRRLYVALPGNGTVDAKLDVPSVAIVGAWQKAAAGSAVGWWSMRSASLCCWMIAAGARTLLVCNIPRPPSHLPWPAPSMSNLPPHCACCCCSL